MKYINNPVPSSEDNLIRYIGEELRRLSIVLSTPSDSYIAIRTVTSSYTIDDSDNVILVDATSGSVTITLPNSVDNRTVVVKKIDNSNNVTIATSGSELIDGAAIKILSNRYESLWLAAFSSDWYIL